jgi:hypothetical protein
MGLGNMSDPGSERLIMDRPSVDFDGNPNRDSLDSSQTHHHQLSAVTLHDPPSAITSFFHCQSSVMPLRVLALGCLERP